MAQPTPYNRQYAFIDFQTSNPTDPLPANQVEIEYNAIKVTLDEILANLALIQRDDGRLANQSVGNDQLETSLRTGINAPTVWAQGVAYSVNDTVVYIASGRSELWLALTAHTSTADFDTDSLVSLHWSKLADFSTLTIDADVVPYDNSTSGLTAADVQAAIDELDALVDALGGSGVSDADYGDITVSGSGAVWTIDNDAVTTAKILDANVTAAKIATDAVTTVKILDSNVTTAKLNASAVTTAKIADLNVTTAKLANLNVTTGKIADDAVSLAKMAHGTAGDLIIMNATPIPAYLGIGAAGQVLTVSGGLPAWATPSGAAITYRKTADESVSNSTTLQDDDDLVHALAANDVITFDVFLIMDSGTSSSADIKVGFSVPTGAAVHWGDLDQQYTTGNDVTQVYQLTGTQTIQRLSGLVVNGANAGNFTLRWAQNVAVGGGGATVLSAGSNMKIWNE